MGGIEWYGWDGVGLGGAGWDGMGQGGARLLSRESNLIRL